MGETADELTRPRTAASPRRASVFESATELARRIRDGEITSAHAVRAFTAQIAAHNETYNAIVLLDEAGASVRAADADAARARGTHGPLGRGPRAGAEGHRAAPSDGHASTPCASAALRVAYARRLGGVQVDREVTAALDAFVERLRRAGTTVVETEPRDLSYEQTWATWGALIGLLGNYEMSNIARRLASAVAGSRVRSIPHLRHIIDPISVPKLMQVLDTQDEQIDALERFLSGFDAWIVPVSATPAIEHLDPARTFGIFPVYDAQVPFDGTSLPYNVATQAYTTLFTVTESPVVSMPVGMTKAGLPVGAQVIGRRFEDLRLLHVAALLSSVVDETRYPLASPSAAHRSAGAQARPRLPEVAPGGPGQGPHSTHARRDGIGLQSTARWIFPTKAL